MQNLGLFMVLAANAVPAIFTHHTEAFTMSDALNGITDITQRRTRAHCMNTGAGCFVGRLDKTFCQGADLPDQIHTAGIAVPAILDDRDIDIDDIAIFQNIGGRRYAMTDHCIGRDAGGLGKTVIAHIRGNHFQLLDDVLVADIVQRFGAHASLDVRRDHCEYIGSQPAGYAQLHKVLFGLDTDGAAHEAALERLDAESSATLKFEAVSTVPPAFSIRINIWQISL